jgi:hypothetical protein
MTNRNAIEAAAGSLVASLPWWAIQSEQLVIRIGALCGALLAIARLLQLGFALIRRRKPSSIPIDSDEE